MLERALVPALGLREVLGCADAILSKVTTGVLGLAQALLGGTLGPQKGLGVALWQDARRAHKIPRGERKAGLLVVLLCGNVVHVDAQAAVLGTAHTPIFVVHAQLVCTRRIAHLDGFSEQVTAVLVVGEEHIVHTFFVQQGQLVQGMGELGRRMLGTALQPLDALARTALQTELAVQFGGAQAVLRTRVSTSRSRAVKLHRLARIASTAPALFVTGARTVRSIGMTALACL